MLLDMSLERKSPVNRPYLIINDYLTGIRIVNIQYQNYLIVFPETFRTSHHHI